MPYYKDTDGKLHFLDDAAFNYLLPAGSVEITDAEAQTIIAANTAPVDVNAGLKAQIVALEQKGHRATREVLAATASGQTPVAADVAQLQSITSQIHALRAQFK